MLGNPQLLGKHRSLFSKKSFLRSHCDVKIAGDSLLLHSADAHLRDYPVLKFNSRGALIANQGREIRLPSKDAFPSVWGGGERQ